MDPERLKRILFVCARGACRSPMAAGFARAFGLSHVEFKTAALDPLGRVDPLALHVMRHADVDIASLRGRALTARAAREADLVVLIAGHDETLGPLPWMDQVVRWDVEDPLGWPLDVYEDIRDELQRRVGELLEWLEREAADAREVAWKEIPAP